MDRLNNKTILIIEDSQTCLALIKAFLKNTGANLLFADKGEEGWEIFIQNNIDLVLTDLNLPDIEGHYLVKKMKNANPDIPVIVQSGCTFNNSKETCLKAGCDHYLSKPYPRNIFINTILKALDRYNH